MAAHQERDNPDTRAIAEFASGLRYEAIPEDVRARIKLLILDSLGCALFGVDQEWSRILIDTLSAVDTSDGATLWGSGRRLSPPHAALVNGTLVQSFELDDVHRGGVLHVGAVTLPALFGAVEGRAGVTGRDLLTAAVAGYEVGPRVGMCMGPEHILQGWHSGATVGVFSAAAGAASGLKLDAGQTVNALGIAGTQAAGLMAAQYGAMVKRMHAGRAAQSGLYGALLAERGFTGIADVLESEYGGFCTTFSRSQDLFDRAQLTSGLGERFETLAISFKTYACVGTNHTTLDAITAIRKRRPFAADEVERIVVHAAPYTVEHSGWTYRPTGITAAQMNLSFCVASLLLEGAVFVDQFTDASVTDPARLRLAGKVEVLSDPAIDTRGPKYRRAVRVEVHLKGGEVLKEAADEPVFFPGEAAIVNKFRALAARRLPGAEVDRLCEMVLGLEAEPDATALIRTLGTA